MFWIIQNNLFSEAGHERLVEALARRKIPHSVHRVFRGELVPEVEPAGPTIIMGSYSLARIAKERDWSPGAFAGPGLDFCEQLPHWRYMLLNSDAHVTSIDDVDLHVEASEGIEPFFLRPTADSKAFSGRVFEEGSESYFSWRKGSGEDVPSDTRVMICSLKEIFSETRFWVVDGKLVTGSLYKRGGESWVEEVPERDIRFLGDPIADFARAVAERGSMTHGRQCEACGDYCKWQPERAYCLDIADTPNGPKIIEVNCLNAAGFYAADLGALVEALETNG